LLDNAATTQKPYLVIEAMEHYYRKQNANIHRGIYQLAAEATAAYEGSRQKVADFIGAKEAKECIFVKGTTEAINMVAQSFTRVGSDRFCENAESQSENAGHRSFV